METAQGFLNTEAEDGDSGIRRPRPGSLTYQPELHVLRGSKEGLCLPPAPALGSPRCSETQGLCPPGPTVQCASPPESVLAKVEEAPPAALALGVCEATLRNEALLRLEGGRMRQQATWAPVWVEFATHSCAGRNHNLLWASVSPSTWLLCSFPNSGTSRFTLPLPSWNGKSCPSPLSAHTSNAVRNSYKIQLQLPLRAALLPLPGGRRPPALVTRLLALGLCTSQLTKGSAETELRSYPSSAQNQCPRCPRSRVTLPSLPFTQISR